MSGRLSARVGRRGLLAGAVAMGAALATGRAAAAWDGSTAVPGALLPHGPASDEQIPEALAATGSTASAPGFPIGHVGLSWSGADHGGRIRLRTTTGWGSWRPVRPGDSGDDGRRVALIPAGGAAEVELDPPPGADDVQLVAINTTDGPLSEQPLAATTGRYGGRFRGRASWGANGSWRVGPDGKQLWPVRFHNPRAITVHHTVTANNDRNPAATVRAIYYFQTVTLGWGDIGYHLLIDRAGVVYEGRYSGPDGAPVFGGGSRSAKPVIAGHVLNYNPGNIGIALLGDLTSRQPTRAARRALLRVLASLSRTTGLDPQGRTTYRNPLTGATRRVHIISGHRDWQATQCPGNAFYPRLPGVRRIVAGRLDRDLVLR
jgi:hypothetical protein